MNRGEIRSYKFQHPDKSRPVLILSRNSVIDYLSEITIAPVTTTIRDIPSEVTLSKADGMPRDCVVNCDHIQTVSKARLGTVITRLSAGKMQRVNEAVSFALELSDGG
jgi:mRNA interferase MazF